MKIISFLVILFSIISLSCCTTPVPQSGSVIPKDFFGIVQAGITIEEYRVINELRADWILETFYWDRIEGTQGTFNYDWYDFYVNTARQHNKKTIAVLAYSTPWISAKEGKSRYISNENMHHYLNFVEKTVKHFKGRVDAWQIWNEPNYIFWKGSDEEFFELSKQTAQRIREVDPDAFIIGGGFHCSSFHWIPKRFVNNMHKAGAMENLDALSFHPYGFNPRDSIKMHDDFLELIKEINFKGEIWITENGYPTAGYYPSSVSLEKFPSYIIKTLAGAAARAPRVIMWYQLTDNYNFGEYPNYIQSEMFFGLVYRNFERKAGAWAYELCARYIPETRYTPELPKKENISSGIVSLCFLGSSPNSNTLIMWNDRAGKKKIRISNDSALTIHNISTGSNSILPNNSILEITKEPVFITWQGEASPLITGSR